jgi:hypothetical protein
MLGSFAANLLANNRSIRWCSRRFFLFPDQGSIKTVPGTNATVVALLSKRDTEFILFSDKPSYLDSGIARIECLFKPE